MRGEDDYSKASSLKCLDSSYGDLKRIDLFLLSNTGYAVYLLFVSVAFIKSLSAER